MHSPLGQITKDRDFDIRSGIKIRVSYNTNSISSGKSCALCNRVSNRNAGHAGNKYRVSGKLGFSIGKTNNGNIGGILYRDNRTTSLSKHPPQEAKDTQRNVQSVLLQA